MISLNHKYDIAVIGGDRRTARMVKIFSQKGLQVICYGTVSEEFSEQYTYADSLKDAIEKTPVIVCGIPFLKKEAICSKQTLPDLNLSNLKRNLRKSHKLFAGIIPEDFRQHCLERNIGCYDFFKEEPIAQFHAVATAEGAILEAMLHKDTMLHQSNVLVLGYGRCGQILAHKLAGLSAKVTVCDRSADKLSMADALGYTPLPLSKLKQVIPDYDHLFNTIPACILTEDCLKQLRNDACIIDIASDRKGADYEAAQKRNLPLYFCPGLPGKYFPEGCAKKLAEFVLTNTNLQ